jgi:hypothetical protein
MPHRMVLDPLEHVEWHLPNWREKVCFAIRRSLIALSDHSSALAGDIFKGFVAFSRIIDSWLKGVR